MLMSHVWSVLAVVLIAVAWAAVQGAWKRSFPEASADPDALAGRLGCSGATCSNDCERTGCAGPEEEERS